MIIPLNDDGTIKEKPQLPQKELQQKLPLITGEARAIFNKANVQVFFIASNWLRSVILHGEHPLVNGIPNELKALLIEGKGIALEKKMVLDWMDGKLDTKNAFILENGDIRIQGDFSKIITTKNK